MKKIINLPLYIKEQELLKDNPCFYQSYIIERDLYNDAKLVNEKHGTFDGQIELVNNLCEVIVDALQNMDMSNPSLSFKRKDIEKWLKKSDEDKVTIFFNVLYIDFKEGYGAMASYLPKLSNYDKEHNCFDKIVIYMDVDMIDEYPKLTASLIHELTHAYEDFKKHEKGLDITLDKLSKDKTYINICKSVENSKTSLDRDISVMFYMLNNSEKNAFVSEFSSILDGYFERETIISYNEVLKLFKEKDVYTVLLKSIALLNNEDNHDYIVNKYNEIYDKSLHKMRCIKLLKNKVTKMFNKVTETLPKIYFDWLEKKQVKEGEGTWRHMKIKNKWLR